MNCSIIVPAYNEADVIEQTLSALKSLPISVEIIVVDDGSKDNTAKIARSWGVNVVHLHKNNGKGAALNRGVMAAGGDILAFVDADLGKTAARLLPLFKPVLEHQADMTIAAFPPAKKGGFGIVQGFSRWAIARSTGFYSHSPLSGQRVLRRSVLNAVGPLASGFGVEVALTLAVLRSGFTVVEIPLMLNHRERGKDLSSFLHRGRQLWAVLQAVAPQWGENR